jgi:hypothetical protein
MGLIEQAKNDWKNITSDRNGFGVELTFFAPAGETATVTGLHTKHNTQFNDDGSRVNSPNVHVSVSEQLLIEQYYPVRNAAGKVEMKNHLVEARDSNGTLIKYTVDQAWPDQTVGVIVLILGNYKSAQSS